MKILDPGHKYQVESIDGDEKQEIKFVKRFRKAENHPGTTNQELLRVLIDRQKFLAKEKYWRGNDDLLQHLRMALVLYESRALEMKAQKKILDAEKIEVSAYDGHFNLRQETQ